MSVWEGNIHYNCQVCNCTMTGPEAMDMHIKGKKHEKNLKKREMFSFPFEEAPSSSGTCRDRSVSPRGRRYNANSARSRNLRDLLRHVTGRIEGLDGVIEFDEDTLIPQYHCSYCNEDYTAGTIGPHLVSSEHRTTYREFCERSAERHRRHQNSDNERRSHHFARRDERRNQHDSDGV